MIFFSREYFEGKSFEKLSIVKNWLFEHQGQIEADVAGAIIQCHKNSQIADCLKHYEEEIEVNLRARIKVSEPEGCTVLDDKASRAQWKTDIKGTIRERFTFHLKELEKDPRHIVVLKARLDHVSEIQQGLDSYVECFDVSASEDCYSSEVKRRLDDPEMAKLYLSLYPYSLIATEAQSFYQVLIASKQEQMRTKVDELWMTCSELEHNDSKVPKGELFLIKEGYMVSSIYNCLNEMLPEAIKSMVREFKTLNGKEELILTSGVRNFLVTDLYAQYEADRRDEAKLGPGYMQKNNEKLRKKMLSNFKWVSHKKDLKLIMLDCRKAALDLIPEKPLFHLKKDLYGPLVDRQVCFKINETQAFKDWFKKN